MVLFREICCMKLKKTREVHSCSPCATVHSINPDHRRRCTVHGDLRTAVERRYARVWQPWQLDAHVDQTHTNQKHTDRQTQTERQKQRDQNDTGLNLIHQTAQTSTHSGPTALTLFFPACTQARAKLDGVVAGEEKGCWKIVKKCLFVGNFQSKMQILGHKTFDSKKLKFRAFIISLVENFQMPVKKLQPFAN